MSLVPLTLTSDLQVVGKKKVYKRVFRKCKETPGRARASVMLIVSTTSFGLAPDAVLPGWGEGVCDYAKQILFETGFAY